jgi:hypothetical protein
MSLPKWVDRTWDISPNSDTAILIKAHKKVMLLNPQSTK